MTGAPTLAVIAFLAASGALVAEVRPDPGGASGAIHGSIEINAPPKVVWDTIRDCSRAGRMAPGVRSCRVTRADPGGRWDVREMTVRWSALTPRFKTVFRSEYDPPGRIRFRCVGGDVACVGEWRLEPIAGGGTRVLYDNRATSPFPAPAVVARAAMRRDVARSLTALRRESEAQVR
ncbi:MAG: SRPBCC family protein [Pseudomonadota bacterium]